MLSCLALTLSGVEIVTVSSAIYSVYFSNCYTAKTLFVVVVSPCMQQVCF